MTNFGTASSHNQHSRLYSHQLDAALPNPPSGTLSGGPNSYASTWDPTAASLFGITGCAPQFCYVDDINSWSTNELAINWNAALAWVASFVADQGGAKAPPPPSCVVQYESLRGPFGTFGAEIKLRNVESAPLDDWRLSWSFIGEQAVEEVVGGVRARQSGAAVTISPTASTRKLRGGQSVTFQVSGSLGKLAAPDPTTFFLNGMACATR